jgi:hypothetical protein
MIEILYKTTVTTVYLYNYLGGYKPTNIFGTYPHGAVLPATIAELPTTGSPKCAPSRATLAQLQSHWDPDIPRAAG